MLSKRPLFTRKKYIRIRWPKRPQRKSKTIYKTKHIPHSAEKVLEILLKCQLYLNLNYGQILNNKLKRYLEALWFRNGAISIETIFVNYYFFLLHASIRVIQWINSFKYWISCLDAYFRRRLQLALEHRWVAHFYGIFTHN